jgi:hypothetical protein
MSRALAAAVVSVACLLAVADVHAQEGKRRALVIGLNKSYANVEGVGKLNHAEDDATAVAAVLDATAAGAAVEMVRSEESRAGAARHAAEEAERLSARQLETVAREAAWHDAQLERLTVDLERARTAFATVASVARRRRSGSALAVDARADLPHDGHGAGVAPGDARERAARLT